MLGWGGMGLHEDTLFPATPVRPPPFSSKAGSPLVPQVPGPTLPPTADSPSSFPPHQYNYGFVVEKTAAARLPPSVS